MEIDLTQLETDGVRIAESFGPRELAGGDGSARYEPLRADLSAWLRPEGGSVRATGELRASVRAECDRCLKRLEVDVDGSFDQRYVWGGGDETVLEEREVELSELDVERLAAPTLDTRALALEQLLLAAPIRVVCSDACRGLCARCGADLNATTCDCDRAVTDPRWDALKSLKNS
jgi:uncharacterized protein